MVFHLETVWGEEGIYIVSFIHWYLCWKGCVEDNDWGKGGCVWGGDTRVSIEWAPPPHTRCKEYAVGKGGKVMQAPLEIVDQEDKRGCAAVYPPARQEMLCAYS